jgi:hypothetical protein
MIYRGISVNLRRLSFSDLDLDLDLVLDLDFDHGASRSGTLSRVEYCDNQDGRWAHLWRKANCVSRTSR